MATKAQKFQVYDETLGQVVSPELDSEAKAQAFQKATANASHAYRIEPVPGDV